MYELNFSSCNLEVTFYFEQSLGCNFGVYLFFWMYFLLCCFVRDVRTASIFSEIACHYTTVFPEKYFASSGCNLGSNFCM